MGLCRRRAQRFHGEGRRDRMNDKEYSRLWRDACENPDRAAFVSHWSALLRMPSAPDRKEGNDDGRGMAEEQLKTMWDIAHEGIVKLLCMASMSQTELAYRFCINQRTVQHWTSGDRKCPDYVLLMMAEALGTLKLRILV